MRLLLCGVVIALAAAGVHAQSPRPSQLPASWSVEVSTSGGFAGRGKGGLVLQSDGTAHCAAPMTCLARLPAPALERLANAVARIDTEPLRAAPRPIAFGEGLCRDCFVITLRLRDTSPDGIDRHAMFSWEEFDTARVPDDVKAVYAAALFAVSNPAR